METLFTTVINNNYTYNTIINVSHIMSIDETNNRGITEIRLTNGTILKVCEDFNELLSIFHEER